MRIRHRTVRQAIGEPQQFIRTWGVTLPDLDDDRTGIDRGSHQLMSMNEASKDPGSRSATDMLIDLPEVVHIVT